MQSVGNLIMGEDVGTNLKIKNYKKLVIHHGIP